MATFMGRRVSITPTMMYVVFGSGVASSGLYQDGIKALHEYRIYQSDPPESPWEDPYLPHYPPMNERSAILRGMVQNLAREATLGAIWPLFFATFGISKVVEWNYPDPEKSSLLEVWEKRSQNEPEREDRPTGTAV